GPGLVQGTDGDFYGTTYGGGGSPGCLRCGTIFKNFRNGKLTTPHNFHHTDGHRPVGGILPATHGEFYRNTLLGGANDDGTVFRPSMGLGPFVKTQPNFGKVGTNVTILGDKLSHATSVTFNGTAATFKVISDSQIETTVPSGATSGLVQVETP